MKKYKIKGSNGYYYLYHYGKRVAGINPKGKLWGITRYFKGFKKLLKLKEVM